MKINPSLLEDVELEIPLKTYREIWTNLHFSVVETIWNYFGASLQNPSTRPRGRKSEKKGFFMKPTEFSSSCEEMKFIFRLICMHLNEIGLQSWMFLDNLPLEEWITGELEWLEGDSRNFSDDAVIEIDKNKVLRVVKDVQIVCIDHFTEIDGYF